MINFDCFYIYSYKMNLEQITAEVCRIAKEAGGFLAVERKTFRKSEVKEKNTHDYVTYVDKETEKLVVGKLSALMPQAGFITEENTVEFTESDYYWIVDPLDGTTNYIHDNAPYCVSIALSYKSELQVGVVYEVCRDECFYAWKGGKAYMNGDIISVSDIDNINQAFIGLDLPYNDREYKPVINHLMNELYGKASSIRINGSASMSMCYVAIGRFDVWAEAFIKPWDYSAGALIVQEAGGLVTDFIGGACFQEGHKIIASNGLLHDEMIQLLAPYNNQL